MKKSWLLTSSILLTGCVVGPDYSPPFTEVSLTYKEATKDSENKDWKVAEPQDDFDRGKWWKIFNDPLLDELEEQLEISNQTILNAEGNYFQARAIVDEARASYYPTLNGFGSATRQKQSGSATSSSLGSASAISTGSTGAITGATSSGSLPSKKIFDITSLSLDASWEPDIWGSVRRTVEADSAAAQASAALLGNIRLSAEATLAQTYFELRALDTDQKLLDDTATNYNKIMQLTINQYHSGVAQQSDILQARSLYESAQAQAINNKITRAQYEHAIAVLLGKVPADFSLKPVPLTATPPIIPMEIPSTLLERRPDVAQAERLMAQTNAQIGVAIAAYFPTLTLSASTGLTGLTNITKLFSRPALNWALGASASELILDGGLRAATVAAARAGYDAAVANYRQTVLTAFQNVEDSLVSLRILDEESIPLNRAAADAKKALEIVINQYKAGTVAYNVVITAQTTAFTAEKSAADLVGLRMTAAVGLIKALGGGWDVAELYVLE